MASSEAPVKAEPRWRWGSGQRLEAQCLSVPSLSFFGGCWLTPLECGGTSGHRAWTWWQISWNWKQGELN